MSDGEIIKGLCDKYGPDKVLQYVALYIKDEMKRTCDSIPGIARAKDKVKSGYLINFKNHLIK